MAPLFAQTTAGARPGFDRTLSGSFAPAATDARECSDLVLVNWNIEQGTRLTRLLAALRGPLAADLHVLQEVDLGTRRTGYRNVAEVMARELGMNYAFGIEFEELAQGRSDRPAFTGQAVLSRFPISRARLLRFNHQLHDWGPFWKLPWSRLQPRRGGRMALVVEMRWRGRPCVIYDTHLESKADDAGRALQMKEILEDLATHYSSDTPVIIAGDFNTRHGAGSAVVRELKARGFQNALQDDAGPASTKVGRNRRVDWVFVRQLRFFGGRVTHLAISDHYPMVVRLALPPTSRSSGSVLQRR
ncbi:MAG: endonuclease/exonuclease/phosphatase family protein [Acidobacteria bacterium]|nr:endonuclease/exonuclease/phosphatase family protein [Acidobacteriota bacterium]